MSPPIFEDSKDFCFVVKICLFLKLLHFILKSVLLSLVLFAFMPAIFSIVLSNVKVFKELESSLIFLKTMFTNLDLDFEVWCHLQNTSNLLLFKLFYFLFAGLPRFTSQPESSSVYKGNSAILNCEVNVDLAPFVRWEQDRQPVFLDDRVFKLPSGALIISNATDLDGGLYRCIIESGGTPKYSDEAELKILPGIDLFLF